MIWVLLQAVWKTALGIFTSIFNFFMEHPAIFGMVVCTLVSGIVCWNIGSNRAEAEVTAKYEKVMKQIQAESQARAEKMAKVEADSKKAAAEAKTEIEQKQKAISTISANYEQRLADALKNPKIKVVKIEVPGTNKPAEVFIENGVVSCRNLPSTFTNVINDMVDTANGRLLTEGKTP